LFLLRRWVKAISVGALRHDSHSTSYRVKLEKEQASP
jgi:hypothetical protein